MSSFSLDLRYSCRVLVRAPLFTTVAVVTLALGIGANTAVFSVVEAVLLRPLPYEEPERLALLWTDFGPDLPQNWISGPEFVEMGELAQTFSEIAVAVPLTVSVTGGDEPEEVSAAAVSGRFFSLLGTRAARGHLITAADDAVDAAPVAVLSHGYFERRFGGDPGVVGRTLTADGRTLTVAGVLPPDFAILHPDAQFPSDVDLWIAMQPLLPLFGASSYAELPRSSHGLQGFGRLAPGVSLEQAQDDMDRVARAMRDLNPDYYSFDGWGISVLSMHADLVEDVEPALLVLLGAVALVLLIACVNVANLMLVRAASRRREVAVRTALGASRLPILRQLLIESTLLSILGGGLGLVLAVGLVRGMAAVLPATLPRRSEIGIDANVLLFTLAVAVVTGILFGLAPAVHGLRRDLTQSFKDGGRGSTGGQGQILRTALVVAEVALALVLLVGAGLLVKSFARLLETDPGYRSQNLLTMRISLPSATGDEAAITFWDQVLPRVESLPGVRSAGLISELPLSGAYASGTTRVRTSEAVPEDQRAIEADRRRISPGYFETMGVELLAGRTFVGSDDADAPLVAIVDERFVHRFWPAESALGKHVAVDRTEEGEPRWREVVGVVAHSRHYGLDRMGREQVYLPLRQRPSGSMFLALRTDLDPITLAAAVRSEIWAVDPDQPVADVRSMQQRVDSAVSQPRFNLVLFAGFAVLAVVLAAVGLYGVLSYSTAQRSQEIGIRMALGAERGDVVRLILRRGLGLLLLGLTVGLGLALALDRVMQTMLYAVEPGDPSIYAGVGLLLATVGAVACLLPAWRASGLHPARVLHEE